MVEFLFYPILPFMMFPPLALLPVALFAWAFWRRRAASAGIRWTIIAAGVAWLAFGVYETAMQAWSRTVIAPIRLDLLLIVPLLYGITVVGAVFALARACPPVNPAGRS